VFEHVAQPLADLIQPVPLDVQKRCELFNADPPLIGTSKFWRTLPFNRICPKLLLPLTLKPAREKKCVDQLAAGP
jgi:hypothetical protein